MDNSTGSKRRVFRIFFLSLLFVLFAAAFPRHDADGRSVLQKAGIRVSVGQITSSSVELTWTLSVKATKLRITISGEPPESPGGPLPDHYLIETLPSMSRRYIIEKLAPAVDLFIRVEAETAGGAVADKIHARTFGEARSTSGRTLREVQLYAPDILRIVLAKGSGVGWQSGNWQVLRRDGRQINVDRVHRHSVPVGAPEYRIGFGKPYRDDVIMVNHRVYLVLAEEVGRRDVLQIRGPSGLEFILPFSDRYLETPVIQVNQVGYNPLATRRYAYVSGWMGDGGPLVLNNFPPTAEVLVDSDDPLLPRTAVLRYLPVKHRRARDEDAGGGVREIDLSSLPAAEGKRYRVHLPGVGVSWPTAVSRVAFFKAFYTVTRGLFHNRWGAALEPACTEWSRPAAHTTIFTGEKREFWEMYDERQPRKGKRSLVGGYHDAGDFDQRPMHTTVPMLLMSAYETAPEHFLDGQLNLPESGNGIPDLLDEALWGVSAWENLQEADGGVRQGVETSRHPWGFYLASDDPLPYWTYARHAGVTARAAGLFAQAARLVRFFDSQRADRLKERAVKAWRYAVDHGASHAYLLYAAGELCRLTGERKYRAAFDGAWNAMGPYGAFSRFADKQPMLGSYRSDPEKPELTPAMTDYLMGYLRERRPSPTVAALARTWLSNYANNVIETVKDGHAHRNPRPSGYPMGWGQGTSMGRYVDAVIAMLRMGGLTAREKQRLINTLSLSADYVLGCNPAGLVYFTGLGSRHVKEPLHLDSLVFIKKGKGPVPGIPVYGPVDGAPGHHWSRPAVSAFYPAMNEHPPALRYGDVRTLATCNEFTVWESMAPHVKLFAVLIGQNLLPPDSWRPGRPGHANPLPW